MSEPTRNPCGDCGGCPDCGYVEPESCALCGDTLDYDGNCPGCTTETCSECGEREVDCTCEDGNPEPTEVCPKCGAPWYHDQGFCGGCEPRKV